MLTVILLAAEIALFILILYLPARKATKEDSLTYPYPVRQPASTADQELFALRIAAILPQGGRCALDLRCAYAALRVQRRANSGQSSRRYCCAIGSVTTTRSACNSGRARGCRLTRGLQDKESDAVHYAVIDA